jgi:hypothetical protein
MSIVFEYLDEHKEMFLRDNPGQNELWLANEHMRKFIGWLREMISELDTLISEYLQKLARDPIFTVVTYQGYDINGYTFYTERQDKKSTYQNSGVVLMLMMLWAKTKACTMTKYKRSGSLTFIVSRFLFSVATGLMQTRVS